MAESVTFGRILTADKAISKGSNDCVVWGTHPVQTPALGICAALVYSPPLPKTAFEYAHQEAVEPCQPCAVTSQPATPAQFLPLVMRYSATMARPMLLLPPMPYVLSQGKGAMYSRLTNTGPAYCAAHASTECRECLFPLP